MRELMRVFKLVVLELRFMSRLGLRLRQLVVVLEIAFGLVMLDLVLVRLLLLLLRLLIITLVLHHHLGVVLVEPSSRVLGRRCLLALPLRPIRRVVRTPCRRPGDALALLDTLAISPQLGWANDTKFGVV